MRSSNSLEDPYFNTENFETMGSIAFHDFRQFQKEQGTLPVVFSVKGLMSWSEDGTGHLRKKTWIYLNDARMNWSDSKELQVCLCMRSKAIKKYRLFSRNFAKLDSQQFFNIYCFKTFNPIHKPRYLLRWLGGHWALVGRLFKYSFCSLALKTIGSDVSS